MPIDLSNYNSLKDEWLSLQPLKPADDERLWQKLRLEWNFHSNHMEGNTLTYGETALLLLHGQTSGKHELREFEEMKGHDLAIKLVRELAASSNDLTEVDIRNLNQILLKEPFYKEAQTAEGQPTRKLITPGRYKQEPNSVRTVTGELFEYASPLEVPARMAKLLVAVNQCASKEGVEFLGALAITHHEFTLIHPFDDGNGRVARLLTNYILLKKGLTPLVVPSERKKDYLAALRQADTNSPGFLTEFFVGLLMRSLQLGIKVAQGESLEEPNDVEKEISLFVREQESTRTKPQSRTEDASRRIWENNFKPLLLKLEEKTREIAKLFSEREIIISIDYTNHSSFEEGLALVPQKLSKAQTIDFEVKFSGYLAEAPNAFSLTEDLRITFDTYFYKIRFADFQTVNKPYSIDLSSSDLDAVTQTILKRIFKNIKREASMKPNESR